MVPVIMFVWPNDIHEGKAGGVYRSKLEGQLHMSESSRGRVVCLGATFGNEQDRDMALLYWARTPFVT